MKIVFIILLALSSISIFGKTVDLNRTSISVIKEDGTLRSYQDEIWFDVNDTDDFKSIRGPEISLSVFEHNLTIVDNSKVFMIDNVNQTKLMIGTIEPELYEKYKLPSFSKMPIKLSSDIKKIKYSEKYSFFCKSITPSKHPHLIDFFEAMNWQESINRKYSRSKNQYKILIYKEASKKIVLQRKEYDYYLDLISCLTADGRAFSDNTPYNTKEAEAYINIDEIY